MTKRTMKMDKFIAIEKLEGSLPHNACIFSGSSGSQTGFHLYRLLPLPVMDRVLKMSDPQIATAKFFTNNDFFCWLIIVSNFYTN